MTAGSHHVRAAHRRLLRGQGRYLDDIVMPGCLHAALLRSSVANANIARIDTAAATAHPGTLLLLTARDLGPLDRPLPLLRPHPDVFHPRTQPPLTDKRTRYVGQPIALVVARSCYEAEDIVGLINVDYEFPPGGG